MEASFISERKLEELDRQRRVELFDQFIDLALTGEFSLQAAVTGYIEVCEVEGVPVAPARPRYSAAV